MIKNILITGANGQDGKIFIKKLSKKKINLILIAKKFTKKIKKNNIKYFEFNLSEKKKLKTLLTKYKIDVILHLASNNPNYGQNSFKKHYLENFRNSKNLINYSLNLGKKVNFISCSSSRIFKKKKGIVNEKSSVYNSDYYSKFRIEINDYLSEICKKNDKLSFTNVILFNHDSALRNKKFILPRVIKAIKNKNKIFINQIIKENIVMDFSHADDICDALIKIVFLKDKINNIILSSGKKTFLNDIIKFLIKKNDINLDLNFHLIKKNNCIIGNNLFAKRKLNWKIKKNIYIAAQELFEEN